MQTPMTAAERWITLESKRSQVLERARKASTLTIPGLLPPDGHTDNSVLPTPFQSLGARGVNNLASKLLMGLFPAGTPFFRLQVDAAVRLELEGNGSIESVEQKLAGIEKLVTGKMESSLIRPVLAETMKHLIVTGNVLLRLAADGMRMYRLDQFVLSRAPNGAPIEAVIKEQIAPQLLSPEIRQAHEIAEDKKEAVTVYTVIEWTSTGVREWQELNGKSIDGSEATAPLDASEWIPLRWQVVPGQSYGRGHCEEYLGDLESLEGCYESMLQFAAAAAKIILLIHPASSTNRDDVLKARSGEAIVGNIADIDVLQLEKFHDFQIVKAISDDLTLRLSHAFLLRSGTVRDAERVTTEEIRFVAQELEDVLGGTYTVLSTELQMPLVRRQMAHMARKQELPELPKGVVSPVIVTGFDALGRNHSANRIRAWLIDLRTNLPESVADLKLGVIARRLGIAHGVEDLDQLIKTEEEKQADQQQALASVMAEKAAAPAAGALLKQQ